jgi:DNA-binding NtrC family response regulator
MRRILVVDDEAKITKLIARRLVEQGYGVETCLDTASARAQLEAEIFDLLISDVRLPDGSGIDLLEHARRVTPETQAILITAYGQVEDAVRAMRLGALDYIQKPFEMDALLALVERALNTTNLREELRVLRSDAASVGGARGLTGESPAIQEVLEMIARVAPTPTTVLLGGESGVGKERAAEAIHNAGLSGARPLVRVNCPAIPAELMESELFGHVKGAFTGAHESRKGWFEIADGGTLFLDEIADIPLNLQSKLLRVLEDRRIIRVGSRREVPVDVRLIVATNVDLAEQVKHGAFREDLFYRLNVFPIVLPPLRDRRADIPALVDELLARIAVRLGRRPPDVDADFVQALVEHHWPGNVRELRNVLERASVLAGDRPLSVDVLPVEILDPTACGHAGNDDGFVAQVDRFKEGLLVDTLHAVDWVKKDAAARLGLSPRALSHYILRHKLDRRRGR